MIASECKQDRQQDKERMEIRTLKERRARRIFGGCKMKNPSCMSSVSYVMRMVNTLQGVSIKMQT